MKILTPDESRKIYNSETKKDIIQKLSEEEVRSIRHLAKRIGKNRSNVQKHVKELENMDIVKLDQSRSFGAGCKKPVLKHKKIISEPILNE